LSGSGPSSIFAITGLYRGVMFYSIIKNTWTINTWSHICFSMNGYLVNSYVNGVARPYWITPYGFPGVTYNAQKGFIGRSHDGSNLYQGYVDEIRIYNRALSSVEVQAIYYFRGDTTTSVMIQSCCPAGTFIGAFVPSICPSDALCTLCDPSYTGVHSALYTCLPCPAGMFGSGAAACKNCSTQCPIGQFIAGPCTSTADIICAPCFSLPLGSAVFTSGCDFICEQGYIKNNGTCVPCPTGTYSSLDEPVNCSTCSKCLLGYYPSKPCSSISNTVCSPCQVFAGLTAFTSGCNFTCMQGYTKNESNCSLCAAGTFNDKNDSTCSQCPVETFSSSNGSTHCTACTKCLPGSYPITACTAISDTVCLPCQIFPGMAAFTLGCNFTCMQGYTQNAGICSLCAAGTFNDKNDSICSPCPTESFSFANGSTHCTACTQCLPGTYYSAPCDAIADATCSPCPVPLGPYTFTSNCTFICASGYEVMPNNACEKIIIRSSSWRLSRILTSSSILATTSPTALATPSDISATSVSHTNLQSTYLSTTNASSSNHSVANQSVNSYYVTSAIVTIDELRDTVCLNLAVYVNGFCAGLRSANPQDTFACIASALDGEACPQGVCACNTSRRLLGASCDLTVVSNHRSAAAVQPPQGIAWMYRVVIQQTCSSSGCEDTSSGMAPWVIYGIVAVLLVLLIAVVTFICMMPFTHARQINVIMESKGKLP